VTGKRSLILAGGGMKVAFQAGVLQVWLDEAGLVFDHADGASGGTFNLAMYCQGRSGTEIADAWRRTRPIDGVSFDPARLVRGEGLATLDHYRSTVFPSWGLDWAAIRASEREATFNACNVDRYAIEVFTPDQMTEDLLVACVSLPMWFPPVVVDDQTYVDAVYLTDANVEEAIRRGADEIWVIWTVSEKGEWRPGFVNQYFQIIEIVANGNLRRIVRRIEENNAALAAGRPGEFGRRIELKILRAEVPVHYIVDVGADRLHEAVNLGVEVARSWCAAAGIPLTAAPAPAPAVTAEPSTLRFTEVMKGFAGIGADDPAKGDEAGRVGDTALSLHLTISIDDVDRFVTDPGHPAALTGHVQYDALGGRLPVDSGTFNLLVDDGDPAVKEMRYRLVCHDATGATYTVVGTKRVRDQPGIDVWADTATLYLQIRRGIGSSDRPGDGGEVVAAGIVSIHLLDFLQQLATFRAGGPMAARPAALARFGTLFLGKLWDVYANRILPWGPL
jgi:predicted patatin/cPLA2 family phospholipase